MQELQEAPVPALSREDLLEEEIATGSRILVRIIPWMEEPDVLTVHRVTKNRTQLSRLSTHPTIISVFISL